MSSRKEHLKKSLGISEYPWSSDDDDQPVTPDVHLLRRQFSEPRSSVVDMPSTSGQQRKSSTPFSPATTSSDRIWSLIPVHNSSNPSSGGTSELRSNASRSSSIASVPELRLRSDRRSAAADIQRILAIRKVQCRFSLGSATQKSHQNALKRLQASRNGHPPYSSRLMHSTRDRYLEMLNNPSYLARHSRAAAPAGAPPPAPAAAPPLAPAPPAEPIRISDSPVADRVPLIELSFDEDVQPSINDNPTANQEVVDVDTPHNTSAMSLEEEIVEIDAHDDTDGNPTTENETVNPVVNADVELNQVITVDANEDGKRSQERRREAPDDGEPHTVKEFNQNLLRLLECPVCLEWMEPPMAQCRRGHLVCGQCRSRLTSCPVCRTTFSSVRNRAMEGVAEMVRYPCRYQCGRELRLRRRGAHEASCGARRYACPAPDCADRAPLPRDKLAHHLQSKHMPLMKIGSKHKFSMKVNSEQHDTWVVAAWREYFSLRVDVDIRTWGVVVYVAYIGPKCNAKNFTYEVSVVGQHNSRKLVYARATHSDLESSSLNVSRQDCFHLTLDQALNFLRVKNRHCEPDKFLDFNVEITKCENENKEDSDS